MVGRKRVVLALGLSHWKRSNIGVESVKDKERGKSDKDKDGE